jgi:hypothetical protein
VQQEQPDNLDAYLDLSAEDIARLVLCLLLEEALRGRLAAFRHDLPAQPVQSLEKLCLGRLDVVPVSHPLR